MISVRIKSRSVTSVAELASFQTRKEHRDEDLGVLKSLAERDGSFICFSSGKRNPHSIRNELRGVVRLVFSSRGFALCRRNV